MSGVHLKANTGKIPAKSPSRIEAAASIRRGRAGKICEHDRLRACELFARALTRVPLCHHRCHESGPEAVHRNAETMQRLHEYGQTLAMEEQGWSREEYMAIFGRNYL